MFRKGGSAAPAKLAGLAGLVGLGKLAGLAGVAKLAGLAAPAKLAGLAGLAGQGKLAGLAAVAKLAGAAAPADPAAPSAPPRQPPLSPPHRPPSSWGVGAQVNRRSPGAHRPRCSPPQVPDRARGADVQPSSRLRLASPRPGSANLFLPAFPSKRGRLPKMLRATWVAIALLLIPSFSAPAAALDVPGAVYFGSEAEARAWTAGYLALHSAPSDAASGDEAAATLARLLRGEAASPAAVAALQRHFASAAASERGVVAAQAVESLLGEWVRTDGVNGDLWSAYGDAVTRGRDVVVAQRLPPVSPYFAPHGVAIVATYAATVETRSGACGTWSCHVATTVDSDLLLVARVQQAGTSDLVLAQVATSTTHFFRYSCYYFSTWMRQFWSCAHTNGTSLNDKTLGTETSYTLSVPAGSGALASRVAAMDAAQTAYDALGRLHTQKARETSTRSPVPGLPPNPAGQTTVLCKPAAAPGPSVPCVETSQGVGDLMTAAPPPNVVGILKSKAVPAGKPPHPHVPGVPSLPPLPGIPGVLEPPRAPPAPDSRKPYDEVRARDSADASAPGDGTGAFVAYAASTLRTFHPNFLAVRLHSPATSLLAASGSSPADLTTAVQVEFAANGSYFAGRGLRLSALVALDDPIA